MASRMRIIVVGVLLLSATGCQSRFGRSLQFWRRTPAPPSAVREAMRRQTANAFDPRTGDGRLQSLEQQLKADPQNSAAHLELAKLYERYSVEDQALDQFTRAYNLDRDSLEALQGMTRITRRRPALLAEIVGIVREFVERHPEDVAGIGTLASLLDDTADLPVAEKLYRRALSLDPADRAWLHNNLGFNLLLQARTADAVAEFRLALRLNPQSQTARNNLGVALARGGDRAGALRVFGEAGADIATAHNNLAVALLEQDRLEESRAELIASLTARNLFQPALENFKLLLQIDREQTERRVDASPVRKPPSLEWLRKLPNPPEDQQ